jgi:hypothetical protein
MEHMCSDICIVCMYKSLHCMKRQAVYSLVKNSVCAWIFVCIVCLFSVTKDNLDCSCTPNHEE